MRLFLTLAFALILVSASAECQVRLPTSSNIEESARIVAGLVAAPTDIDNIVTIAETTDEGDDYFCVGSLIAPEWVITAAQCFIRPFSNFVLRGATSLSSNKFEIIATFSHPGAGGPTGDGPAANVHRDDIQLVRLAGPVKDAVVRSPTPTPSPPPGSEPETDGANTAGADTAGAPPQPGETEQLPEINPNFNFMLINNNTDFAMDQPRYLRVKGFGITTQPQDATEPLRFRPRDLKFADLKTAPCDDGFGTDNKRRLCTERSDECGPCYGDVGAPLYDVDSSGTTSVLVGIVTFGQIATSIEDPVCTTGERPVAYTAVASYVSWIKETIKKETGEERVSFFQLPKNGISNTDLARDNSPLAIFATTSVIVISCLALLGTIVTVIVTCVVRRLRKKRKRWIEGLQAEESFVKAGEKDAIIVDPFEGIQSDQHNRFSFTGFSRAAIKGATDFSSRSIGMLKKMVVRPKDEDFFEPRELIEDAPDWVPGAWNRLFMPPSKKEFDKIHTIPTQRVVDDVLSGNDKAVELTPEEVAYKTKRDEANLEAAWAKLEIQTSIRNLSEVGGSAANLLSPPLKSPSASPMPPSPRKVSRNSSRAATPLGSGKRKLGDLTKTDTLLAAFASIDADAEQVAEETTIDSSALRALAEAKRPNVLATLRRKFSSGATTPSTRSDRESDGEEVRTFGSIRGDPVPPTDSKGTGRLAAAGSRLPSGRSSRVATALSGLVTKGSLGSRQSSMLMDYFSEDYSVSNSGSDDDEHVAFEDMFDSSNRRYTEDRKPQTPHEKRSVLTSRSMRKSQNRSFEKLERSDSSDSLSNSLDTDGLIDLSIPQRERSNTGYKDKSTVLRDEVYKDLPMSTSSMSSDKRPRSASGSAAGSAVGSAVGSAAGSSIGHSGAGPSSQIETYSELALRHGEQISVHMEEELSMPIPRLLPDRAVDYQASRVALKKTPSSQDKRTETFREKHVPSADNISVHMEEETPYAGRVVSSGIRDYAQAVRLSGEDTPKNRIDIAHHGHSERNEAMTSVHMEEDASLGTKPVSRAKVSPSANGPSIGGSKVQPRTSEFASRQKRIVEDRVSIHKEEVSSYSAGGDTRRKNNRIVSTADMKTKNPRPTSERLPPKTSLLDEGETLSVHMEEDRSAGPSVRARINAFDKTGKRALRRSDPLPGDTDGESNISVAKLKSMWNEIARRNSEDSNT